MRVATIIVTGLLGMVALGWALRRIDGGRDEPWTDSPPDGSHPADDSEQKSVAVGDGLVTPDEEATAAAAWAGLSELPTLPGSGQWSVLVDTRFTAGYTDLDLRYLDAQLYEQGVPTRFLPWGPWGNYGPIGAQFALQMLVDSSMLEEARQTMRDLLTGDPRENRQVRFTDRNLMIPGTRDQMVAIQGLKRASQTHGGRYRVAWGLLLAFVAVESAIPVAMSLVSWLDR